MSTRRSLRFWRTLARAEGFFALPTQIVGHGLPDVGGRFIRIHTAHGTKTVHVRFVRVAAFDQLYAVLLAVAGTAAWGGGPLGRLTSQHRHVGALATRPRA